MRNYVVKRIEKAKLKKKKRKKSSNYLLTGCEFPKQGCCHQIEPRPSMDPFPLIIKPSMNEKPSHVFVWNPEYSDFVFGATMFPES